MDFSFEVWRSLSACEGAILMVDANNGVQVGSSQIAHYFTNRLHLRPWIQMKAQTIAHFNHALLSDLAILPVINKIDLKNADIESVLVQMKKLFEFNPDEILKVSAKTGVGVSEVLDAIIEKIPPPTSSSNQLKAVVFDLWYEKFKGIVLLIRMLDGNVQVGNQIVFSTNPSKPFTVKELNVLHPNQVPISRKNMPPALLAGQVGVLVANINDYNDISIGDVMCLNDEQAVKGIMSEKESRTKSLKSTPMVYASIYPCDKSDFVNLQKNLQKLLLNDSSVHLSKESHPALGNGFR